MKHNIHIEKVHKLLIFNLTGFHKMNHEELRRFPDDSDGKESACNAGDLDLIPELGRSPGERYGYPLQYSGLENSMDHSHGVTNSHT